MGMVRFAEWLREEGQPGSTELLQYYKDVRSQAILMQEVKVSSQSGVHPLRSSKSGTDEMCLFPR